MGVMALIVVLAVMTGFTSELRDKILGVNSHIVVQKAGGVIYNHKGLMERIQTEQGVVSVTPYTYSQTMVTAGSGGTGVVLRGIEPESAPSVLSLPKQIIRGDLTGISGSSEQERKIPGIIIGKQGGMLREIGRQARLDMEKLLGARVFLELWVRVQKKWRKDPRALKEFGYQ